jgi:hypothetical protein
MEPAMLRLKLSDGTLILGLDAESIQRLKEGKPIKVDLDTLGGARSLAIMYGDTLADIQAELEAAFGTTVPIPSSYVVPGEPQ